jgi:hypothetical protein
MLVAFHWTAWCHVLEERSLHSHSFTFLDGLRMVKQENTIFCLIMYWCCKPTEIEAKSYVEEDRDAF